MSTRRKGGNRQGRVSTEPDRDAGELKLLDQWIDADKLLWRGLVALALVPIWFVLAVFAGLWWDAMMPMIFAAFYALIGGSLGILLTGIGAYRRVQTKRKLNEIDDGRLARARLLRRPARTFGVVIGPRCTDAATQGEDR
jgi:hypothetical protein